MQSVKVSHLFLSLGAVDNLEQFCRFLSEEDLAVLLELSALVK